MSDDSEMRAAIGHQMQKRHESMLVDRRGWTRGQWIADARDLMDDIDGAVTSLVNGHILALLDEARDADALRAAVERVRALHVPWYEVNGVHREHRVLAAWEEAPADHVCVIGDGWDRCSPDEGHYVLACAECRWTTEDGDPAHPLHPCPTIRALDTPDPAASS
jgi:hypothetical protein